MGILGNTQILAFYKEFQHRELSYTREVAGSLGLLYESPTLKIAGENFACLVHSLSFSAARIVLRVPSVQIEELRTGTRVGILRISFQAGLRSEVEEFTLSGKFTFQSHKAGSDGTTLLLVRLDFNHRPPEGLIEIQGRYLKLRSDAELRKDLRITVDEATLRLMGMKSSRADMVIDQIPRKCVLREVSFGGATVILGGVAKFLGEREFRLSLDLSSGSPVDVPGKIIRAEPLEGYKAMAVLGLSHHEDRVPGAYLRAVQKALDHKDDRPKPVQTPRAAVGSVDTRSFKIVKN